MKRSRPAASTIVDLFPHEPRGTASKALEFKPLRTAAWTHHKATFIRDYLKLFVAITQHGTYIDGFAGPQRINQLESWSAKLVLESRPKRLREFHLCEQNLGSFELVKSLVTSQYPLDERGRPNNRFIFTYQSDFNVAVDLILSRCDKERTATFCLLDQRTFECHWETVRKLAAFKRAQNPKIELFYFLAVGWLHRSFSAIQGDKATLWWGDDTWIKLKPMSREQIRDVFIQRFRKELGYKHVYSYPILKNEDSGHTLYDMIHASDHDEAPKLMSRAYRSAVRTKKLDQASFIFRPSRACPT